jgi:hypothetical protein
MKNIYTAALIIAISAILFSCGGSKYKAELKTIDSLNTVIDSIQAKLSGIDTVKIKNDFKDYMSNISKLKKYFNDKKEDSTWQLMTSYGAVKSSLKSFIREYPGYYSEIKFSRGQLDSLKIDIESGNLQQDKIKEYTKTEAEAVSILKTNVRMSVEGTQLKLKLLDSLNPKVNLLIEKLKKEGKIDKDSDPGEAEEDD